MSAFKKLNRQDVYLSDYIAKKSWVITQDLFPSLGVEILLASSGSINEWYGRVQDDIYKSIRHLYYPNVPEYYDTPSGSRDLSYQSTSTLVESRTLGENLTILSIPRSLYGTHIEPGTFKTTCNGVLFEDRDGKMVNTSTNLNVGDIIYNQGIVVFNEVEVQSIFHDYGHISSSLEYKSSLPIFTLNTQCKVKNTEMNYTYNPTAITGSDNIVKSNITGSTFTPYVTTVGLYNDAQELVAVGKLNRPVPLSQDTDTTFVVKIDI